MKEMAREERIRSNEEKKALLEEMDRLRDHQDDDRDPSSEHHAMTSSLEEQIRSKNVHIQVNFRLDFTDNGGRCVKKN